MKTTVVSAFIISSTLSLSYGHTIQSPKGKVKADVFVNNQGNLAYTLNRGKTPIMLESLMGINVDGKELGKGVKIEALAAKTHTGSFPWIGISNEIQNNYIAQSFTITQKDSSKKWRLDTRCYDTGFAFRYSISSNGTQKVVGESTTWKVPADAALWHRINTPPYQTYWKKLKAAEIKKDFNAQLNVTIQFADGTYGSLNEAGSYDFSGASLMCHGTNELTTHFANNKNGWKIKGNVITPWRIVMTGPDLNTLVNCNLTAAVCPAPDKTLFPQGCHTEWIQPARSLWQWWGYWNPGTLWEKQRWFVDNAAALGCEYYLVDEGWEHPAQGWITKNRTAWQALKELADYAKTRGVKLLVWRSYPSSKKQYFIGMETPEKRTDFFKNCQKAGVYGCKLDFLNHEGVQHRTFIHDALKEAAVYHQVVNFHGVSKPMGQARTYPNEVSREGIIGLEHNKWETIPRRHYATTPFTRFISGHGDFTVTTFQPNFLKGTTSALQLATAVVYTSPALHWADKPQYLLRSPAVDLIRSMPTMWDETIVLPASDIGKTAAFARRKGQDWYVAYINGTDKSSKQNLSLSFLGKGNYAATVFEDVSGDAVALGKKTMTSDSTQNINFKMSPGGGFVAIFRKLDATPYGGPVYTKQNITLNFPKSAEVHFTLDGSEPTADSPQYKGAFLVEKTCQLRAAIIKGDGTGSAISTHFVQLPVPTPVIDEVKIIKAGKKVSIMSLTKQGAIYYTTDGSTPNSQSTKYTQPLKITKDMTLKAICIIDGKSSAIDERKINIIPAEAPAPDVHLSDLKALKMTTGYGKIQMNKNISKKPLKLSGKVYQKGIGTHAVSALTYELKPDYKRFVAAAGVDDLKKSGSVSFAIEIDGKQVYSTPTIKGGIVWNFNIPIPQGAKTIRLLAKDGGNGIDNDHVDWVKAGFLQSASRAKNNENTAPDCGIAGPLPVASRASLEDKTTRPYIFANPDYFQWGGSVIRDKKGTYHMFYSRWRRDNPRGMYGWLYVSEIAHATATRPEGPFKHQDVVLKGFGEPQSKRWDAFNAHNPCITKMKDPETGKFRYYLYYIANRDDNTMQNDWWDRIINQRVGVAVADSLEGPWKRHPNPVISPPNGRLHHYLVNPGVCQLPGGRYMMVLKGRAKGKSERKVGPMLHGWALSDKPEGPFIVQKNLLFPANISAEDPCVWVQGDWIMAAVKDWGGQISGRPGISYIRGKMQANDSISWSIPDKASLSAREIKWTDGKSTKLNHLERPCVLLNEKGIPSHLYAAASTRSPYVRGRKIPSKKNHKLVPIKNLPFNLCLPLVPRRNLNHEKHFTN